jgi:indole-3-glycerol phosphate synthase
MSLLRDILDNKQAELAMLRLRRLPAPPAARAVSLRRAIGEPLKLIAEHKRRSPSAGPLSTVMSIEERAQAYARGGASMISVLCDRRFFDGDYEDLQRIRQTCDLPLLCKEFVVDECQLDAARAYGADAVLLIVRCVTLERLTALVQASRERQLEPLVEAHGPGEVDAALASGASWIGVNARDLDTLVLDRGQAEVALAKVPSTKIRLHLSGIKEPPDVALVAGRGMDAALIGECLMRVDDPEPLLRQLVAAGR